MNSRIPPHSIEIERALLSSCFVSAEAWTEAQAELLPEHFYPKQHQRIFAVMLEGDTADTITIAERLKGEFPEIHADLAQIAGSASSAQPGKYVAEIKELAALRSLISAAHDAAEAAYSRESAAADILGRFDKTAFETIQQGRKSGALRLAEILPDAFNLIEAFSKGGVFGISTGLKDLDRAISGMQRGDLIVIAGRPSMGKSALGFGIAEHVAKGERLPALIFSSEMSRSSVALRMLCAGAEVSLHSVRSGYLPKRDFPRIALSAGPLAEAPIYIDDTPGITARQIRTECRKVSRHDRLGVIVVDYLQLLGIEGRKESRNVAITEISASLKSLAREFDCPVIALSQLSREVEKRVPPRPQLSDLRDSGAIEQDADVVLLLYRERVYNPDANENIAEIIIGKQRNGPIGTIRAFWSPSLMIFRDLIEGGKEQGQF